MFDSEGRSIVPRWKPDMKFTQAYSQEVAYARKKDQYQFTASYYKNQERNKEEVLSVENFWK